MIFACRQYTGLQISDRGIYMANTIMSVSGETGYYWYEKFSAISLPAFWDVYLKSLGAVFFEYNLLAGILIALGLLMISRISFLLSLLGFASGWIFYSFIGADFSDLGYSFIGFNFILTAIALGGIFLIPSRSSFIMIILITPIVSVLVAASSAFLSYFYLPVLALPFNLAVISVLYCLRYRPVYRFLALTVTQYFSPEKNLYTYRNWLNRFGSVSPFRIYLPFFGEWTVSQGHNGEITHKEKWKHAWDFVISDEHGKTYKSDGRQLEDFYCFNIPVTAPADGWVTEVINTVDDNAIGEVNLPDNWGNTIILKHAEGLYSKLSHLKKGSIEIKPGTFIHKGEIVGYCGNSGRSPEPHLHFQLQTTPYIGSYTLDFPLAGYISQKEKNYNFHFFERPGKDQLVSNIIPSALLTKAFTFTLGKSLYWESENLKNRNKDTLEWEVKSTMLNQTYLYCKQSGSCAYFINDGILFYFTGFEGDRNSLLYHFYLSAQRILLGNYQGLTVKDDLALSDFNQTFLFFMDDFVAPFFRIKFSEYEINYTSADSGINPSEITLNSSATVRMGKMKLKQWKFEMMLGKEGILEFRSSEKGSVNRLARQKFVLK